GWTAAITCGFDRFATYAVVKSQPARPHVFATEAAEKAALQRTPLDRLGIEPVVREELAKLGVRTVADFGRLPGAGVLRRFDAATHRLHRMAAGTLAIPMQSSPELEPVRVEADLDPAESDLERLLFRIKQLLDPLLDRLESEGRAAIEVLLQLAFEVRPVAANGGMHAARPAVPACRHVIRPAVPTLDVVQLLGLLRLRLEIEPLPGDVSSVTLEVRPVVARQEQLSLFVQKPKRDERAAARALARVRA